jgi:hypothetical protein
MALFSRAESKNRWRLLHNTEIQRIADINALRLVSKEVVEIARQQLVSGAT